MAREYKTKEFPPDEVLERKARACPLFAHCPDRPYSFCMKGWLFNEKDQGFYFRKITYKHCYECINGVEH